MEKQLLKHHWHVAKNQRTKRHFHNVCTVLSVCKVSVVIYLLSFPVCYFASCTETLRQPGKVFLDNHSDQCSVVTSLLPDSGSVCHHYCSLFLRKKYDTSFSFCFFDEMYDVNAMRHSLYGVYCQHGDGWLNMFNKYINSKM